jgi:predicted alpha/beta superfamily hydrolase
MATGQKEQRIHYESFGSDLVESRNLDIWLPPSYSIEAEKRYPVIYMHDGQNLFEDTLCGFGVEWGVDETLTRLSAEGKVPECIVVGIWNTPKRYPEYQPQKPYQNLEPEYRNAVTTLYNGEPVSDNYLKFIVQELKPFIDQTYRTLPERDFTIIMGSSMGGLISLYAICEYPEVFAGAGCLSTHWVTRADLNNPEMARVMIDYLDKNLPSPKDHKIYFDHGTKGLDAYYGPHQKNIDRVMKKHGYIQGKGFESRVFEGADHNEISWQERLAIPMEFLLSDLRQKLN